MSQRDRDEGDGTAEHWLVRGRVQGVGFRWFVQEAAARSGAAGWVRNLPGGEVEIHAEGAAAVLESLLAEIREGPRFARVDDVERRRAEPTGATRFTIRP